MSLGERGNGFDFQIDPFRFGGRPATVTSVPYPIEAIDEFDGVVEGAFNVELLALTEDFTASSQALSGNIRDTLRRYYHPIEDELDSSQAVATGGNLVATLQAFSVPPDEFDGAGSNALSGSISRILIRVYSDIEEDSFDGVQAVAIGGTLS